MSEIATGFVNAAANRDEHLKGARLDAGFFNFINGQRTSPGGRLQVVNPATTQVLAQVPDVGEDVLDQAVQAARAAFPAWAATPWA